MAVPLLCNSYFGDFASHGVEIKLARDETSMLERLRLEFVEFVFFPSLPFVGVMLFPSFALWNASGEGSAPLAPFSPFSVPLSLSLLSSPSPSFPLFCHLSFSPFPFLPHKLFPSLFFFSSFPPLSFPSPSFFFFFF